MTGPIRKRAGISGWEELNEGSYPEKRQESRMGYHFRGDPSGKRQDSPDRKNLMRGPIRKRTRFPGQEELNEGTYPGKHRIFRTGRT